MQRVGTGLWACSLFACTTFGVGDSWPVVAAEPIYVPSDGSLFWADIKDVGFTYEAFGETLTAGYEFSAGERSAIEQGLEYWQLLLQDNAQNSAPLRIMVIPSADAFNNASGLSAIVVSGPFAGKSWLAAALADNWFGESGSDWDDYLGFVLIGQIANGEWTTEPLTSLPQNGNSINLTSALVHEIAHVLGLEALLTAETGDSFGSTLSLWEQGLRDSYGQKAAPHMSVVSSGNKGEGTFVTQGEWSYSGVYFTGEHVAEVLQGALLSYPEVPEGYFGSYAGKMPGVPVNGWELVGEGNGGNENGYIAELSHIELQNSLLSHQYYRNWNTLMEAEIAVMQDLGLSIDRRAWYGYSIYNSGLTITNNHPFYARENGQYLIGQPSTMPWGIGLHVYGSNNHITQQADLLADGAYAVGIRLEGQGNDLTVAKGTRIQANGYGGTALMVSYGRNHQVQLDGSAVALGPDGIAARLDFGGNIVGNSEEIRGSWIRAYAAAGDLHLGLPSELQGALVNSFNVAGTLAGSKAAIYISDKALVERINILSGASVWGDIVSEWNPDNDLIQTEHQNFSGTRDSLYTQLNFGQRQGHDGRLYDDSSYDFTMYGNISGQGIKLNHRAGRLSLAGTVDVYAVNNNGTMALYGVDQNGYAISTTNFTNGRNATLEAGFTVDGRITRIQADQAQLAGTLALRPQTALYANEQKIDLGPVLTAESVSGAFEHTVVADYSPTLDFSLQQDKYSDGYQVTVSRKANAYSQHAANAGAASLGQALAQIANQVQSPEQSLVQTSRVSTTESSADHSDHSDHSDMDELLVALDWSDPAGHEVTQGLNALGANAYDIAARASLNQQSTFNSMLLQRYLSQRSPQEKQTQLAGPEPAQPVAAQPATAQLPQRSQQGQASVVPVISEWNVWVTPYASGMWQSTASNTTSWSSQSYGLMLGADRSFKSGLKLGAHLVATDQRTKAKDELRATIESNAVLLGVHGSYAPDEWHGGWLAAQARVGVESSDMERTVAINGYVNSHESSWTGVIGSVLLGGGKDWQWQWQAQAQGQEREQSNSLLSLGPLAFVEYSFLQRPALDESKGNSSRLGVDRELYDSLRLNVGAHMSYDTVLSNGASFGVELLGAVRYELQDEFKTGAHFLEYGDISFTSQNELPSNDSLLVQGALRFASPDSAFFARKDVGGEISRDDYRALQVGLQLGWYF